jgi:Leucine-rich repeat (LRR) protein
MGGHEPPISTFNQTKKMVGNKGYHLHARNIYGVIELTIFTTIDFSCNGLDGLISEEIGELKVLYILNLSHNAFTGQIPSSLGKLSNLESLDLSINFLVRFLCNLPMVLSSYKFSTFPSINW